jgi:hypothetical protein
MMTPRNSTHQRTRKPFSAFDIYHNSIFWVVFVSILPTVVLLFISYFQAITSAKADLDNIVKIATGETNQLLEDAEVTLRRSNLDLQAADNQTAVNLLRRKIGQFKFEVQHLLKTGGKGKSRDQDLMAL